MDASAQDLLKNLDKLPPKHYEAVTRALATWHEARKAEDAKDNFLDFVKVVWPAFIEGPHHRIMAEKFEKVARGELKRIIINIAPRHGKSELTSWLLPAWMLGRDPSKKIIAATHTADFSVRFGRKVRNLIDTNDFKKVFPNVSLRADSKAAGRWDVSGGGEYFAVGVGGAMTGRGADLLVIDDPHSETAGISPSLDYFDGVYEWYASGPRQRLQPGGAIIIVMTRWHQLDLTGQILQSSEERKGSDKWEVIELPAMYEDGEPLWPDFWSKEELDALKAELPITKWAAQYQQKPTSEEGALIKREYWREWRKMEPPACNYIIQSIDTAHTKNARSDYSAITTWGVFDHPNEDGKLVPNIILLDSINEKLEFPELKKRALECYYDYEPDGYLIEAKAAGLPLIQELRASGIPVTDYTPSRGQDKISRVNSVSDIFANGIVWYPKTHWAEEVVEQCAAFPNGAHDDLVDCTTLALMRFRQGGFLSLTADYDDEPSDWRPPRRTPYY
jgi:predicted phage terminase large subunit-like protein